MMRQAQFAGSWYPGEPQRLREFLQRVAPPGPGRPALAVVAPHAGYVYSGVVAGAVYAAVEVPGEVVLLSFNHRGWGEDFAVWPRGAWKTPIGDVPVAEELVEAVKAAFPEVREDPGAFQGEHSGELQVPFLRHRNPAVRIAPVSLNVGLDGADRLGAFGEALARVSRSFLVVASTDMSHYDAHDVAVRKDRLAIEAIQALDVARLVDAIVREGVTMCGFAPTLAVIAFAKARGAAGMDLVQYQTSGDVTGDRDRVVGYAGMVAWAS